MNIYTLYKEEKTMKIDNKLIDLANKYKVSIKLNGIFIKKWIKQNILSYQMPREYTLKKKNTLNSNC